MYQWEGSNINLTSIWILLMLGYSATFGHMYKHKCLLDSNRLTEVVYDCRVCLGETKTDCDTTSFTNYEVHYYVGVWSESWTKWSSDHVVGYQRYLYFGQILAPIFSITQLFPHLAMMITGGMVEHYRKQRVSHPLGDLSRLHGIFNCSFPADDKF